MRRFADASWRPWQHGRSETAHLALGTWHDGALVIAPFDPATDRTNATDQRPLVSAEYEAAIKDLFPPDLTAEEYAARYGAAYLTFTMDDYRYPDAAFDEWIQRLGLILHTPELLTHYRATLASTVPSPTDN